MPESVEGAPLFTAIGGEACTHYVEDEGKHMVRDREDAVQLLRDYPVTPYNGPVLTHSEKRRGACVNMLVSRGLARVGRACRSEVGIFVVWKRPERSCG